MSERDRMQNEKDLLARAIRLKVAELEWTRNKLAKQAKVDATQLSRYLNGDFGALSQIKIDKLLASLRMKKREILGSASRQNDSHRLQLGYCPHVDCPCAELLEVGGIPLIRPIFFELERSRSAKCIYCNTTLEVDCPSLNCNAKINEGVSCSECGTLYVELSDELRSLDAIDLHNEVQRRRFQRLTLLNQPIYRIAGKSASADSDNQ